jgi:acetyltransferase
VATTEVCATGAAAVDAANRLGYPAVLKVQHPELSHKSDVGGVEVGMPDPAAVAAAAERLLALAPGALVMVQRQHRGLELVVGGIRDPGLGPMVMVGIGGITVELFADTCFAVAPVDAGEATGMWLSLRSAQLLTGYRGSAAVDLTPLAALVVSVGHLLLDNPDVTEVDLNPVMAGPDGYVAVDWRIACASGVTGVKILPPGGEEP